MLQFNKKLTALAILTIASMGGATLPLVNSSAQAQPSGGVKDVTW